jgi:BlaI family transcriptional regulator, penicillinase repressor
MALCVNVSHIAMISLNQNELEALRILWDRGELKPAEIQAHFSWPIENATLRSVLINLVEKKHVARRLLGKAFFYAARVPKATLLQTTMRTLARVFAGGSHQELVVQLMETSDIKAEDLKLIRQTAAGPTSKKTKRKSK